ncbi:N-acetylmuramoyl-L-alanine amidase [Candidatus Poribacteria bacterium]|nr:N-acetylmuramoyl-L-alanine amidase [Candidatus Poribacteria bacterium]
MEAAEGGQYGNSDYISIDDVVRIFKMVKYWHPTNQKVILEFDHYKIEMFINNSRITIEQKNEKKNIEASEPPRILNGKVMLSMTFVTKNIAEMVNLSVIWVANEKTLKVNKSAYTVNKIRVNAYPNYTRIAIDVSKDFDFKIDKQISTRLSVAIPGGIIDIAACKWEDKDVLIKEIVAIQNKNEAMLYIDLKSKSLNYKSFLLTNPFRFVIDVIGDKAKIEKLETTLVTRHPEIDSTKITKIKETDEKAVKNVVQEEEKQGVVFKEKRPLSIVVIDPGHGGKDPGAIGPTGLKEKDVVLKISKELRNLLVKNLGIRVILTREGDYFIPLEERTRIANFNKADLFISVHTNASFKARSEGFEVFYFSAGMNIDPYALAVVKKENSVMKLEENKINKMSDIDIILYDVLQTEYVKESKEFAIFAQQAIDKKLSSKNRGVKQGPFFVLRNARMPSVLVESNFITNRKDEENLKKDTFLNEIARALFDSVVKYKKKIEKK